MAASMVDGLLLPSMLIGLFLVSGCDRQPLPPKDLKECEGDQPRMLTGNRARCLNRGEP